LDEREVQVLEELALNLAWSWRIDARTPKSFPMNTYHLIWEAKNQLFPKKTPDTKRRKMPRPSPPPKRFADLLSEERMKFIYEHQHNESYEDAVALAGKWGRDSSRAFHKLIRVAQVDYGATMSGLDEMPKPKVHLLHRELLDIAVKLTEDDFTNAGFEEFFEDICPCKRKHNAEAIRKLRKRTRNG